MEDFQKTTMEFIVKNRATKDGQWADKLLEFLRPIEGQTTESINAAIEAYKKNHNDSNPTIAELYESLVEEIEGWLNPNQIEKAKRRNIYTNHDYVQEDWWRLPKLIWENGELLTNKLIEEMAKFITVENVDFEDWSKGIILNWKRAIYPRYGRFTNKDFINEDWKISIKSVSQTDDNWKYKNKEYQKFVEITDSTQADPGYIYELIHEVAKQFKYIWIELPEDIWYDFLALRRERLILLLQMFRAITGIEGKFLIQDENNRHGLVYFLNEECWVRFDVDKPENKNISFIAQ